MGGDNVYKIELGSTLSLRFQTQVYNETTNTYVNVKPDVVFAQLENLHAQKLIDLVVVEHPTDVGVYDVFFDTTKYAVEIGVTYFIAFYWQYGGYSMCERVKVKVVHDVQ